MTMFEKCLDHLVSIVPTLGVVTINSYTITSILRDNAFPLILAFGSLILTIVMIIVQFQKHNLLKKENQNESLTQEKIKLEIQILKDQRDKNNQTDNN